MKRLLVALFLPLLACAQSWLAAPASYTCRIPYDTAPGGFVWHTVKYSTTNITVVGMIATTGSVLSGSAVGEPPCYMFSDGPAITTGPDLAAGAWGWPTGATFSGAVAVNTNTVTKVGSMPVGYAVVGTSSNPATITVGGSTITVTNSFDTTISGLTNSTTITMTTTGWAKIGITQMCSNEWYVALDGVGDVSGCADATSINTNSGFLSYTWTCNPSTNVVVMRFSKYGGVLYQTNIYHLSHAGYIAAGAQLRIPAVAGLSPASQQFRFFGWRAIYGPTPSADTLGQLEIDARAEYTARGWGR